jgi:ribosomal protein S18 acetylase RimI-like enzyme
VIQPVINPLVSNEADAGYTLMREATQWLQARGLPAWCMPRPLFEHRLAQGCFYGAYVGLDLAGVVSLTDAYHPAPWADLLPQKPFLWLSSLTVARRFAGQGIGSCLLATAEQIAHQRHVAYLVLDCYYGDGKLPAYYQQHGYRWIARRVNVYDDGIEHDDVLMEKQIAQVYT